MAIRAQNTDIFWCTSTSHTTSAAALIDGVVDWSAPSGAANIIDITDLKSIAKEKMVGIRDEGELSLTLIYNATDAAQQSMISCRSSQEERAWIVRLYEGTTVLQWYRSHGYVSQFAISGAVDDKIMANAVIMISGPVTFISTP